MKTILALFISFSFCFNSFSQKEIRYTSTNKKAIKYYESATKFYDARDNQKAIIDLQKAIEKDPSFIEAYSMLAYIYTDIRQLDKAMEFYNKAIGVNSSYFPNNYFILAGIELSLGKYENVKLHYEKFLNFSTISTSLKDQATQSLLTCDFGIEALKHPVPFNPLNLGEAINSKEYEYFPAITADDQTLLYTRKRDLYDYTKSQEDFYISKKVNGQWMASVPVMEINTPGNEGAPNISADGQIIFFAACEEVDGTYGGDRKGYGSCDIFYTQKIGDVWTKSVNLGPPVNSKNWESQPSFSSDGKTLYFVRGAVSREGIKNQDIYMSQIQANGSFSNPVKLSDKINTKGREESPFIHHDNQTFYFSSDGHTGMGDLDIFVSRREPNGEWGTPMNLGYPINTWNSENSLLVGPLGDIAYFASDRTNGLGGLDLYSFELYDGIRPHKTTYMKGKVFDAITKKPLEATFELIDLESAKIVMESSSNRGNGEFLICLPINKDYALNVSRNGYLFYSENFSLKDKAIINQPFFMDVPLQRIDTGMTVELKNIFFETNKYDLKEESKAELQKLINFLTINKTLRIEISGHTDNVGDKKLNQVLSENRAKSVNDYLLNNAIAPSRITYKGYGDSKPKVENDTPENRAKNRRTEFKVIGK